MSFKGKDILTIGQLSVEEIMFILEQTTRFKQDFSKNNGRSYNKLLDGKQMIYAFFEDSTRTRTSHMEAMLQLGGNVKGIGGTQGTSVNKGESIYHTVKMYQGYGADVIVVRHKLDGTAQMLADKFVIPVINGGDGAHEHPTQTLLDLFTIRETQHRLDNLTVSLVGDLRYGRTVHSLATALSLFPNNKVYLVSPEQVSMPEKFLNIMKDRGTEVYNTSNLEEAVKKSDIVYMTRLQQERLPDDLKPLFDKLKGMFRLEAHMLEGVKDTMKIMHPLPIPKDVQEVAPEVEDTPYCYYFEQAQNGLYTRMALLGLIIGAIDSPEFAHTQPILEASNFQEVTLEQKPGKDKVIADIVNGLIIDHLPPKTSGKVIELMGYSDLENVFPGRNVRSTKYGRKDFIKIESDEFDLADLAPLNKLALIYPQATVNLVKNKIIVRKGRVRLPSEISDMVICPNGGCVTRPEHHETNHTSFYVQNRNPLRLECHYCGTEFGTDKITIKEF